MPFLVLKTGPFFVFFVSENLIIPAERREFFKKKKKTKQKKDPFLALKTGPILLQLGPVFYAGFFVFLVLVSFLFWLKPPIFIVFSAKNAKFQEKKKDTICEHNCANCSCQNVRFFSAFFIFANFGISIYSEMFLIGFPKSKNYKIPKQEKENKNNNKKTRCKTETNQIL